MAIKAIKGIGKAFLKASKEKGRKKLKALDKRDTARFQGVYRKHRKALEAVNKPAKDELDKTLKSIKSRVTKGKSRDDQKDIMKAHEKYDSKIFRKGSRVKMYDDLPDIRQRFRGAPGPQRKITRGIKNYIRRAEALQKDRLKRLGPIRGKKK
jgi:hypothetical protein